MLLAAAQADVPVREATPNEVKVAVTGYGAADKEQVGRMVTVILQLPEVPTPDDTADALATAICIANSERTVERRVAAGGVAGAAVMDRAAIAPIARGETPYERAVREALARRGPKASGKAPRHAAPPARAASRRDRLGRGRGRRRRRRFAGHRGRAASGTGCSRRRR